MMTLEQLIAVAEEARLRFEEVKARATLDYNAAIREAMDAKSDADKAVVEFKRTDMLAQLADKGIVVGETICRAVVGVPKSWRTKKLIVVGVSTRYGVYPLVAFIKQDGTRSIATETVDISRLTVPA